MTGSAVGTTRKAARVPLLAALLVALLFSATLVGCGRSEQTGANAEWARIAAEEGWPQVSSEEMDTLLDTFVQENAAFAEQEAVTYFEPIVFVVASTPEDPESKGIDTHILALDSSGAGAAEAMRDLGGMVARAGQRPLAVFLVAETGPDGGLLPPSDVATQVAGEGTSQPAPPLTESRALVTQGMTVDGRINEAVQPIAIGSDGTYELGEPSRTAHVGEAEEASPEVLRAFYQGYVSGRTG